MPSTSDKGAVLDRLPATTLFNNLCSKLIVVVFLESQSPVGSKACKYLRRRGRRAKKRSNEAIRGWKER